MKFVRFLPIAAGFFLFGDVRGVTLRVPEDYPSILEGLDAATEGDSVLVGPGVWTVKATRGSVTACGFLKGGVALVGRDGPDATVIDAGGSPINAIGINYGFYPGKTSSIEGFSLRGIGPRGRAINSGTAGSITIRRCVVADQAFEEQGTAIKALNIDLLMEDCVIARNSGFGSACGVHHDTGSAVIRRCRFEENQGLALGILSSEGGDSGRIEDCEFIGNFNTNGNPGAALVHYPTSVVVRGCLFFANKTTAPAGNGGSLWPVCPGSALIEFNTFAYDSAVGGEYSYPGALTLAYGVSGTVRNNTFFRCYADADPYVGASACVVGAFDSDIEFVNNVIVESQGNSAVGLAGKYEGEFPIQLACNVYWNNAGGDFTPFSWPQTPPVPDIVADPLFCGPEYLDLTVRSNSPALPALHPGAARSARGRWAAAPSTSNPSPGDRSRGCTDETDVNELVASARSPLRSCALSHRAFVRLRPRPRR